MPGIEVHLPSIEFSSPRVKWRLLVRSAERAHWALRYTRPGPCRNSACDMAEVSGNQSISADEIRRVLAGSGQLIVSLVPAELEMRLRRNFPELLSAQVSVGLPNDVTVTVSGADSP